MEFLAGNRIRGTTAEKATLLPAVTGTGGWVEVGRTTLGSKTSPMTVTSLPDKRYYMVLSSALADGTNRAAAVRRLGYGSVDTGNNYASRRSDNGASDSTNVNVSEAAIVNINTDKTPQFGVDYVSNLSSKEKLAITHLVHQNTAGAGTAPARAESVWKWTNTSNPLDTYEITREPSESGDWEAGSEVVVLGWDDSDTHGDNFWEELASVELGTAGDTIDSGTITAKKYLWFQVYTKGANTETQFRFNSDSGANYASRRSGDGGSDSTFTGETQSKINSTGGASHTACLMNGFIINNSANEKLVITHQVAVEQTGAGTSPRRSEGVTKWANTSASITSIQIINNSSGDFGTGSILKVWGSN